jgi:peptidyl-tRNA hydrolase, PTH2 family
MRPAMYIFLNKGLGMSTGKAAAQAGHAAVEGYRLSCGLDAHQPQENRDARENAAARHWYRGGHYTKLVMEASDAEHLRSIRDYIEARGFKGALIIDEGHTEIEPFTPTALGVEIVDKDDPHAAATFGEFKLFTSNPSVVILDGRMDTSTYIAVKELVRKGDIDAASERLQQSTKRSLFRRRGH